MPLEQLQNGRYRLIRLIGSGNMGEVYLAEDTRIDRQVAIKVIRSEVTPYPDSDAAKDAVRLFQQEAKTIAIFNHSNILPLYDFGEDNSNGTPLTYMVMPFCPDGTLATWLQTTEQNRLALASRWCSFCESSGCRAAACPRSRDYSPRRQTF